MAEKTALRYTERQILSQSPAAMSLELAKRMPALPHAESARSAQQKL
jgi:hypothetical protein